MKIPFFLQPYSWIIKDKEEYELAKLKYYYSGYELEEKILKRKNLPNKEYENKLLDLQLNHGKISVDEYWNIAINKEENPIKKQEYRLMQKLVSKEISDLEFDKEKATLYNEPWVKVINSKYEKQEGINGFSIELDWNEAFINFLKENGYSGRSDKEIVDTWFQDIVREVEEDIDENETALDPIQVSRPKIYEKI